MRTETGFIKSMLILGLFFFLFFFEYKMFALRQSCNCDVVSSAEKAKPRGRRQNSLFLRSAGWMHKQLQQLLVVVMHDGKSNKRATTDKHYRCCCCCCCEFECRPTSMKNFHFLPTYLVGRNVAIGC